MCTGAVCGGAEGGAVAAAQLRAAQLRAAQLRATRMGCMGALGAHVGDLVDQGPRAGRALVQRPDAAGRTGEGGFSQAPECYRSPAARSGRSWRKFARSVAIGGRVAVWAKLRANASLSLHMFISWPEVGSGRWPCGQLWWPCGELRANAASAHNPSAHKDACALSSKAAVRFEQQRGARECGA
jgi:hypothetical protein